jgi:hypothetical protein
VPTTRMALCSSHPGGSAPEAQGRRMPGFSPTSWAAIVLVVTARSAPTSAAGRIGSIAQTMVVHHAVETTTPSRTVIRQPWVGVGSPPAS